MSLLPSSALVLLDTNLLVRIVRNDAVGQRVLADQGLLTRPDRPLISVVTLGEIESLAEKLGWQSSKRVRLRKLLQELVVVQLGQGSIVAKYAQIDHYCEKVRKPARPMAQNDLWISATASATGATLFTTDSDFDHLHPVYVDLRRFDAHTGAPV